MTTREWTESMDGSPSTKDLGPFTVEDMSTRAWGFIKFQAGPIDEFGYNGTTIEDIIQVLLDRLDGFQHGPFACHENAEAIALLKAARSRLESRTKKRQDQGVEGKNLPHKS